MAKKRKYVYFFGNGKGDGNRTMKDLFGGKGSGLAEMTNAGLPVPPGFTISTEVCTIYYEQKAKIPTAIDREIDGRRIGVWGGSFGAYWAARLAFVEAKRIKGAVFHGGNVHYGFQEKWLVPAFTTGGATYLFGPGSLLEARGQAMGTKTMEEFLKAAPKLSLKEMGLIDRPSAPLLGVNGKLDDQAPVDDIYLLMEHGSPKSARIYADGHHMGRTPGQPAEHITATIVDWLKRQLAH